MKIIFFLLNLFIICNVFYAQTEPENYVPLSIGNKWVYRYEHHGSGGSNARYIKSEVLGDTTINSRHYFKVANFWCGNEITFMRYDSTSGFLMRYNAVAGCDFESHIIQLSAVLGDSNTAKCRTMSYMCRGENDTTLFGINTFLKYYYKESSENGCQYENKYSLLYGIGPEYRYDRGSCRASHTHIGYLKGAEINGVVYGDTIIHPSEFILNGNVVYEDNNEPVNRGYVKMLRYNHETTEINVIDSVAITLNGTYRFINVPTDTMYLMAFDDDETILSKFVPTYYTSSIDWQSAVKIYPVNNTGNVNIRVYRNRDTTLGQQSVTGSVFFNTQASNLLPVQNAILYAKRNDEFSFYAISAVNGKYKIGGLKEGTYQIICKRLGFPTKIKNVVLGPNASNVDFIFGDELTGINQETGLPDRFSLSQNYPNPFNPVTVFKFGLPKNTFTKLVVYDLLGREVASLVNSQLIAGNYSIQWDASSMPSGVYFYRLTAGDFTDTKKMVLIK